MPYPTVVAKRTNDHDSTVCKRGRHGQQPASAQVRATMHHWLPALQRPEETKSQDLVLLARTVSPISPIFKRPGPERRPTTGQCPNQPAVPEAQVPATSCAGRGGISLAMVSSKKQ
jgi:hypothetical protein